MKKHIYISLMVSLIASASFAGEVKPTVASQAPAKPAAVTQKSAEITVNLYDSPSDKSKVIKQLPVNANIAAIFEQGDFIKVGDRTDGSTGWINKKQYQDARNRYYQQYLSDHVESFYMKTVKGKDGKTIVEAYRNGKQLTETEANKMYMQMQAQEKQQWDAMQRFNLEAQHAFDSVFYPGIIVIEPTATPADQKKNMDTKK